MKIIDLLNKIANGEGYPKIKFNNSIYEYHDKEHGYCRYYHDNTYICLNTDYYLFDILNDEVEIIEEPQEHKIPEKIDQWDRKWHYTYYKKEQLNQMQDNIEQLRQKYNKIIDYLEVNNDGKR